MVQQLFLDSKYSDHELPDGGLIFWIPDPIHQVYGKSLFAHVISAWIPLTFFNVFEGNNSLKLVYDGGEAQTVTFQEGNRDVDYLVETLNSNLLHGHTSAYDAATNRISVGGGETTITVADSSTCLSLLGIAGGQTAAAGGHVRGVHGVNLTRTSAIFIRTNLHCSNRDPLTKRAGDILCKIPITHQQPLEIISYDQPVSVRVTNQTVSHVTVGLFDDAFRPLDLNGVPYSLTLQFTHRIDDEEPVQTIERWEESRKPPAPSGSAVPQT